jgi:parvulin-like peptidyl-prolyl isomerase
MLKSTLDPALLVYSSPKKSITNQKDNLEESNQALKKKIDHMPSDQDSSLKKKNSLEDSLKMLKGHVKAYVSESIKSTNSQPPDIHDFDLQIEISKFHPVLWNVIFRMTASEDEEKKLKKDTFHWEV